MKRYQYTVVRDSVLYACKIRSTSIKSLDEIISELLKTYPSCNIHPQSEFTKEVYEIEIEQKGKNQVYKDEIRWWIFKQLCNHGWKPIGEGGFVFEETTDKNVGE